MRGLSAKALQDRLALNPTMPSRKSIENWRKGKSMESAKRSGPRNVYSDEMRDLILEETSGLWGSDLEKFCQANGVPSGNVYNWRAARGITKPKGHLSSAQKARKEDRATKRKKKVAAKTNGTEISEQDGSPAPKMENETEVMFVELNNEITVLKKQLEQERIRQNSLREEVNRADRAYQAEERKVASYKEKNLELGVENEQLQARLDRLLQRIAVLEDGSASGVSVDPGRHDEIVAENKQLTEQGKKLLEANVNLVETDRQNKQLLRQQTEMTAAAEQRCADLRAEIHRLNRELEENSKVREETVLTDKLHCPVLERKAAIWEEIARKLMELV